MKFNFTSRTLFDNERVIPVFPKPAIDLNELFELKVFSVSKTSIDPFEEIQIKWDIQIKKEGTNFDDFHFSLVSTEKNLAVDIEASGTVTFSPHKNTFLRIAGRIRGVGRNMLTLGSGIAITVDMSDVLIIPLFATVIDYMAEDELIKSTNSTSKIKLRDSLISNWSVFSIEYIFPLEIVIPEFFNGDLDLNLNISFDVNHDATDSILDVSISYSFDVDFHWLEDILSLGTTKLLIEPGIKKMVPLILESKIKDIEKSIINKLQLLIGSKSDTHRLLDVRLIIDGNFTRLEIVLFPFPEGKNPSRTFGDTTLSNIL